MIPKSTLVPNEPAAAEVPSPAARWLYALSWDLHHPGGVNEVVRNLHELTATHLGYSPLIVVRKWDQRKPSADMLDGRRTFYASWPMPCGSTRHLRMLISFLLRFPRAAWQLRLLLRAERVAVVHVHYPGEDAIIWPLLRMLGAPGFRLILSFHGLDARTASGASGLSRAVWRSLLRHADHITVCSTALRERLLRAFPDCRAHVHVIENGVNAARLKHFGSSAVERALPQDFIFSAGTYEHKKGHDILMAAFDRLAARWPKLGLLIAGRYDPVECQRLEALRRSLQAGDRVELLHDVSHEDTIKLMARSRCFVLASRDEPFGIVVLEAGVLGRPVVCTDICGVLAYLPEGKDLAVVPVGDAAAMADAIDDILVNREAAEAAGRRLSRAISETLDWKTIAPRYAQLARATEPARRHNT